MEPQKPLLGISVLLAALGLASPVRSADRDFGFQAEHLLESAVDARYVDMPWTAGEIERGRWHATVQLGAASTGTSLLQADGTLIGVGASLGLGSRWALEGIAFYDRFDLGGDGGAGELAPLVVGADVGENRGPATFGKAAGRLVHRGASLGFVRQGAAARDDRGWALRAGVLVERYDVEGFETPYVLDTGAAGVIGYSGGYDFVGPYVGAELVRPLGRRFTWSPSATVVSPRPRQSFDVQLQAAGVDVDGTSRTRPIGDTYLGLGVEIRHRRSGLALDVGSSLYFPLGEAVQHPGVDRALTLQLVWHG